MTVMNQWAVDAADGVQMDTHEDSLRSFVGELFPDGGVFIDVGANMGLWSVILGRRASRVVAVEPSPAAVAVLHENVALNGLEVVVEVLEMAAWDENTALSLLNPPGHEDPMTGWMRVVPGGGQVAGRRLDDALPPLDRIDLVKIDTEGADLHVLRGMRETLARHRPVLFIESHHLLPYGYRLDELTGLIGDLGYGWEWAPDWSIANYLVCRP